MIGLGPMRCKIVVDNRTLLYASIKWYLYHWFYFRGSYGPAKAVRGARRVGRERKCCSGRLKVLFLASSTPSLDICL